MIRVLLCDDDVCFLDRLKEQVSTILCKKKVPHQIHTYSDGNRIGQFILASSDVVFLDVDFATPEYDGISLARKIRQFRSDTVIIFVTNYIEYAPEGYEVQAFRYVLKKDVERKLQTYLDGALSHFQSSRKTIKIRVEGEIIDVPVQQIVYFEAQLHMVSVVIMASSTASLKRLSFYSTLKGMEEQMRNLGFLRVHKSYLINMRYIKKFTSAGVQLKNDLIIPVSEKSFSERKREYLLWRGRQQWID